MSRVFVAGDETTEPYVEIVPDDELGFDGTCSDPGCGDFTISDGRTRYSSLADAIQEAEIHMDYRH